MTPSANDPEDTSGEVISGVDKTAHHNFTASYAKQQDLGKLFSWDNCSVATQEHTEQNAIS